MPDAARPLADNRLGVMVAQAFPGPGNSGVTALGDPPADYLLGHIEQVVAAGFGAIEVTRLLDPSLRARVRDLVAPLEVTFGAYVTQLVNAEGLHPFDLAHPDDAHRRRAVDRLRICLDEAGELGARRVGVMSGRDPLLFDDTRLRLRRLWLLRRLWRLGWTTTPGSPSRRLGAVARRARCGHRRRDHGDGVRPPADTHRVPQRVQGRTRGPGPRAVRRGGGGARCRRPVGDRGARHGPLPRERRRGRCTRGRTAAARLCARLQLRGRCGHPRRGYALVTATLVSGVPDRRSVSICWPTMSGC